MENRNTIWMELNEISPVLARIPRSATYQVPGGYFEGLPAELMALLSQDSFSPALANARELPYQVPAGYFEGLPEQILRRLQENGSVLPRPAAMQYEVPEGYFDQLPNSILSRIRANEAGSAGEELEALSPLLGKMDKRMPFSVPGGYFEELPENSTEGAKAIELVNEELENLSPLMSSLQQQPAYQVPEGYFDALPGKLLQKVRQPEKGARVLFLSRGRRLMQYAAAAVVAGFLLTAGIFYLGRNSSAGQADALPGNELATAMTDSLLPEISDSALENYVETHTGSIGLTPIAESNDTVSMNPSDMQEMLADVSDAELQKYIEQYGGATKLNTN